MLINTLRVLNTKHNELKYCSSRIFPRTLLDHFKIMFFYWLYIFILGNFSVRLIVSSDVNVMHHSNWLLLDHDKCGNSNTDRIIGGKNANMGAYPWIARIGYIIVKSNPINFKGLDFICGGTLINKYNVVTAAHCVTNLPKWLKITDVRLGEYNTMTDPDCEKGYCAEPVQDIKIKSINVHKDYNHPKFRNDIAIIRLDKPAIYNEFVIPICMPHSDLLKKDYTGEMVEVAGWGIYDIETSKSSKLLQTITMPIQETRKCKEIFKTRATISDQQICVGGVIGIDSCRGDSGGPLMKVETIDELPKYYIIGIVSFGVQDCGATTSPGVYTKISHYIIWILDNINS
ncbi:CLIP domain-containing serine protease 2-like [Vespa crabro]|uniref:CLIP domain-containing serine protease 2-like n=1 Tax=Vespa crabro TaxID=7445 RepID=UPI001F0244C0|nr:CLIP domain-containing serine protease 2-like [Vespa crabro]